MSGQIPGIKEAGNMRRCSFIISLTQTFRMATTAFICEVEDTEGSVRSLKLKQRGCSYTLIQVLVGVLAVLVLAMTGGIIWMKMSQKCPSIWTIKFTGPSKLIDTDFTSPRSEKYMIRGKIVIKDEPISNSCNKTFRLVEKKTNSNKLIEIRKQNVTEDEVETTVHLEEGSRLRIQLNCDGMYMDEANSFLNVYPNTC